MQPPRIPAHRPAARVLCVGLVNLMFQALTLVLIVLTTHLGFLISLRTARLVKTRG
jgi:hypothetical protein